MSRLLLFGSRLHDNTPATLSSSAIPAIPKNEQLWQEPFLQKSSSFLKALRRAGRRGKVLIQGWVAFRDGRVSWKEIMRNPKRYEDFRYIILLDDTPHLHLFTSRPKQKKLTPKPDLLQDCMSLHLTEEIAVSVNLVSKEFGNEVCIVNQETNQHYCNLLPIPMPQSVFLDKHRSRLAKGDALKSVFDPFKRSLKFASSSCDDMINGDPPATIEQFDVSRHLLFVLDAAVQFPLPRPAQ